MAKDLKKSHGNAAIEQLMKRQSLINQGTEVEKEVTGKNNNYSPEGEKIIEEVKEQLETPVLPSEELEESKMEKNTEEDEKSYESFFQVNEKFEGQKDVSVYIYAPLHYKLKSIVTASNKKTNMTILLSNIVEDFFIRYDKKIKKSLKKLTDI